MQPACAPALPPSVKTGFSRWFWQVPQILSVCFNRKVQISGNQYRRCIRLVLTKRRFFCRSRKNTNSPAPTINAMPLHTVGPGKASCICGPCHALVSSGKRWGSRKDTVPSGTPWNLRNLNKCQKAIEYRLTRLLDRILYNVQHSTLSAQTTLMKDWI